MNSSVSPKSVPGAIAIGSHLTRLVKLGVTRSLPLPVLTSLVILLVLGGLAYVKFGRRLAPLDQKLAAQFPALAEGLASRSAEFMPAVRQVGGREVVGLTIRRDIQAKTTGDSDTPQAMPAGLKPVEQEALRLMAERNGAGELNAFFPQQYAEPFVVEGGAVSVVLRPLGATGAASTIENGKVVYRDAYPETDSLHAVSAGRSEEFLYLRSANAPRRFEYELSDINGAREVSVEGGAVRFKNDTGPGLQIEAPWMLEASGKRREDIVRWELGAGAALPVSCLPPSGGVFPIGTTPVQCKATDASQNTASCTFTITVRGVRDTKLAVLNQLIALRAAATAGQDRKRLDEAIDDLRKAVEPGLWLDASHPKPRHGETVFKKEADVVKTLDKLLQDKHSQVADAALQEWIARLVMADRVLALVAIKDAKDERGNLLFIFGAFIELIKGDLEARGRDYDQSIEHYSEAWQLALKSTGKL